MLFYNSALASPAHSQSSDELPQDLTEIGLKNLLNFDLEVTLPGRKKEKLSNAASAAFVLTSDDIRRSGARHITDALRLIPGVNVAQAASNKWAVSIRGFNQIFSNQLLVLLDGVSIFSPTTNGVYWESNEFVLEDIDRIEVIRGPGATLWGGNALNGVINIITKHARDTEGTLVSAGGGTHERHFLSVRQGEQLSEDTYARVFLSNNRRTQNEYASGGNAEDDWESFTTGVRIDSQIDDQHSIRFTSDIQSQKDTLVPTTPILTPPFSTQDEYRDNTEWFGVRSQLQHEYKMSDDSALETILSYSRKERKSTLVDFHYDQLNLDSQVYFEPFT
ncbi:MAG: TonB-dependent receptor, partial [Bdellovibrionales bacterium]|nr:TonB-dependent receptor [Bdellovibrionales bacterium]